MKTTVEYLDAIKVRLDLPSDYAVAKALGLTRAAVSKQRLGHSVFDDTTALRVAEILGVDPMEVISAANAERARDEETRRLWERAWGKVTGATAVVAIAAGIGLSAAPSTAKASPVRNDGLILCQILYVD
ncbi:helix-turn-helix domain-containing protein [Burkholderia pseudomallei]|uniref:DUF3693 domain-containing protein n=1 Tax=Burkholderia pseudomallei TaxID=28450 RepID=UPI000F082CB2|nr:DUF3693 domain-containing protein [Burkholderia pseudomallei]MCW0161388.1 DUF3693 domain-containing protein [Burkholderia pseudomallei]CAJ3022172.1 helix-turn-helix domain-containing protein [Burkholderia pseudomallei]CAJ6214476.1 helix-turn-helix domain-containing protein [Burkholderia pseudomallei]CAJ6554050.1 helix-turn-helix domain-containing protein [Burkholderia pseudomallei]VBO58203.1 helix-turn-helix domain-containing protein [Burkholderia pseudomallei]